MKLLILLLFLSFVGINHAFSQTPDTSQYVVLHLPSDAAKPGLTQEEIIKVEQILSKCIKEYNLKQLKHYDYLSAKHENDTPEDYTIDLKHYKRKFFVNTNANGDKIVWANCFCETFAYGNWRNEMVLVDGGDKCLFDVHINLNKASFFDLFVHGSIASKK